MTDYERDDRGRHREDQKDSNAEPESDHPPKSSKPPKDAHRDREDSHHDREPSKDELSDQPERQSVPSGRRLVVINNGDKLSRGRPVQLNEKKAKTWEGVLADISDKVRPTFGAVKRVFTPTNGTEVKEMEQLEPNGVYVISGSDKFQQIPNGYDKNIVVPVTPRQNRMSISSKTAPPPKEPVAPQFSGEEVQDSRRGSVQLVIIHVFRNGDDVNPPAKVMLRKFDLWNILRAKDTIAEKVKPAGGFCKNLCTLDGKLIEHVADLKTNGYYVAVGPYEKFRHVEYTLEGRPNMVVPIKRSGKNPYEVKEAEQPGVERKRRRTFVVRLKKNSSMTDDEGEEDPEERHTRHRHSTERHHGRPESPERHHRRSDSPDRDHHHRRSHSPTSHERERSFDTHTERGSHHGRHRDAHEKDEKKRHHSKENRHRHHRDEVVIEDSDQARHGLYAQGRADLNKSAHSVMLRDAINKSHSQLVVGSAKSRHDQSEATLGPSRSQSLPGGPSQRNLGEPKSKLGFGAGSTAVLTPGSTANLTPGSTLNVNGTSQATLKPSTSRLSVHSHISHKSRAGSKSQLDLEENEGTSKAELRKSQHSRVFDAHSKHHHSHREGEEEYEDYHNHHISHRLIPSYIDERGEHHDAEEVDAHSGQTGAVGDHDDGEPGQIAAGKSHRHDELHSHVTTVGPDGEIIHTERHDITEHDEEKKPKKKKGGCC